MSIDKPTYYLKYNILIMTNIYIVFTMQHYTNKE